MTNQTQTFRWATKINANNDVNGNPRRAYLVYEMDADVQIPCLVAAIDEEYAGIGALNEKYPNTRVVHPVLDVTAKVYKSMLKEYGV